MVEYILGNYLVEINKISKEQLNSVLEQQSAVRVKLGLIAIAEGFMTTTQAEEVNKLQAVKDKRFGDIAVEQGYLTDEQVGKLLKAQGNTYFMFVQTLVDLGILEMAEIDRIVEDFRKDKGFSNSDIEDIKSDDPDRIIPLYLPEQAKKYQELIGVAVRTMIRLIDRHIFIGEATICETVACKEMTGQKLEGKAIFADYLVEESGALLKLGSVFGQEEFAHVDEDVLDAASEFLNCVNGLYASAMSREGEFLELLPPEYTVEEKTLCGSVVCKVPIYIDNKELYFIVVE